MHFDFLLHLLEEVLFQLNASHQGWTAEFFISRDRPCKKSSAAGFPAITILSPCHLHIFKINSSSLKVTVITSVAS